MFYIKKNIFTKNNVTKLAQMAEKYRSVDGGRENIFEVITSLFSIRNVKNIIIMRKSRVIKKHPVKLDKKYNSLVITCLKNKVMKDGEARKASQIVYQSAEIVEKKLSQPFPAILETALENVKPNWEIISWKIGGANYRIPRPVSSERAIAFSLRQMVKEARGKKLSQPMFQRLATVIIDAYNKTGEIIKKKENIHKEAASNMAFASFLPSNRK